MSTKDQSWHLSILSMPLVYLAFKTILMKLKVVISFEMSDNTSIYIKLNILDEEI